MHPDDPPHPGLVGSSLGARYPPASPLQLPRTLPGPAQLEASRSRYPASPRAWNPLRAARRPRSPPPLPCFPAPPVGAREGGGARAGQGRSRLRAASQARLAAGGGPAVSQRGRPARAARGGGAEDGLGRALGGAGGGAGARGGVGWRWGGGWLRAL